MNIGSWLSGAWSQAGQAWSNAVTTFGDAALYARQYYGHRADAAFQAHHGNALGWAEASAYDLVGGYISLGTGSGTGVAGPAGVGQGWWSVALSVPLGLQKAALAGETVLGQQISAGWVSFGAVVENLQLGTALSSAYNLSAQTLWGGQALKPVDALLRLADFGGALGWDRLAGFFADRAQGLAGNPYLHQLPDLQAADVAASHLVGLVGRLSQAATWAAGSALTLAEQLPAVGGVLFDRCDVVLCDVAEIHGGYWDEQQGCLVLTGREADGGRSVASLLAPADADHLRVALRASLAGTPPGVSIDPEASWRHGALKGSMLPDGAPMLVSYLGGTEGTRFGAILFEADRVLKNLASGIDNLTRQPVACNVPGYRDLLSMPDRSGQGPSWHRFWFVIDRAVIRKDSGSSAFLVGDVRLKVLNETELPGQPPGAVRSPDDDAFCRHLTEHYDAYSACFPVLARLKELAKLAALARYLVDLGVPLDLGTLFGTPPLRVPTPDRTPACLASRSTTAGGTIVTRQMCGGVDLSIVPQVVVDNAGAVRRALQPLLAARPTAAATGWRVRVQGAPQRGVVHRLGVAAKAASFSTSDHTLPGTGTGPSLTLRRSYSAAAAGGGRVAGGWEWCVPYVLTVVAADGKRSEVLSPAEAQARAGGARCLVLHSHGTDASALYLATGQALQGSGQRYCRVLSMSGQRYSCDPADAIEAHGDGFRWRHQGVLYTFGSDGRLERQQGPSGAGVRYAWQDGELAEMRADGGAAYRFVRRAGTGGPALEVHASNGDRISYVHDHCGLLLLHVLNGRVLHRYRYDEGRRLVEIRDGAGAVVRRLAYGADGSLVTAAQDTLQTADGSTLQRRFAQPGFVESITDHTGATAQFRYGSTGALETLALRSACGLRWQLGFDSAGRMAQLTSPAGQQTRLEHDREGRVERLVAASGEVLAIRHDAQGCSAILQAAAAGPPAAPPFQASARGKGGAWRLSVRLQAAREPARELQVDAAGRLRSIRVGRSRPIPLAYDDTARTVTLQTSAGRLQWTQDAAGLSCGLTFLD